MLINDRVRRLVPVPFVIEAFVENVAREIGKPVHWVPSLSSGTGMTGLSVRCRTTGAAVIFSPAAAPPDYAAHCVGHESWHLLEGHLCTARDASSAYRDGWPGWLARRREHEAERFAKRIGLAAAPSGSVVSDDRTRRLASAFGLYAG
ncbi:MAG TPA: hypothetical protein VIW24_04135 [Aldersonia sp.]